MPSATSATLAGRFWRGRATSRAGSSTASGTSRRGARPFGAGPPVRHNTTLAVVATNAALDKVALEALAHAGSDALARRITPYGTLFDGDVVFAASTATHPAASPLQPEALAAEVVPEALERAVRLARGTALTPGLAT